MAYLAAISRHGSGAVVENVQHELLQKKVKVELASMRVALQRLRHRKLVTAKSIPHDHANRVEYRLTAKGRILLQRWRDLLR